MLEIVALTQPISENANYNNTTTLSYHISTLIQFSLVEGDYHATATDERTRNSRKVPGCASSLVGNHATSGRTVSPPWAPTLISMRDADLGVSSRVSPAAVVGNAYRPLAPEYIRESMSSVI